jgi:hypothetical protein
VPHVTVTAQHPNPPSRSIVAILRLFPRPFVPLPYQLAPGVVSVPDRPRLPARLDDVPSQVPPNPRFASVAVSFDDGSFPVVVFRPNLLPRVPAPQGRPPFGIIPVALRVPNAVPLLRQLPVRVLFLDKVVSLPVRVGRRPASVLVPMPLNDFASAPRFRYPPQRVVPVLLLYPWPAALRILSS